MYDLTDCSEGPSKCKIRKTEGDSELIDLVDDDDDDNDVIITYVSNTNKSKKICVTLCGFSLEEEKKLNQVCLNYCYLFLIYLNKYLKV